MIRTVGAFGAGVVTTVVVVCVFVVVTVVCVTTLLVLDAAVVCSPAEVCAVTSARSRWPVSSLRTPYVWPVAPLMLTQAVPSAAQRCHCRENVEGVGDHVPFVTDSVPPTTAEPESAGRTEFDGPFFEPTTSVAADVADALPSELIAVTTTRTVWPTSPATSVYVLLVAAVMSPQPVPSLG